MPLRTYEPLTRAVMDRMLAGVSTRRLASAAGEGGNCRHRPSGRRAGVDQPQSALGTFEVRSASGLFSHTLYSALFCCGLIYAIGTPVQPRRLGRGIGLVLLAMRAGKGHANHRAVKHVLRASLDLAHELARSGGEDSPGVTHERAEIARLRARTAP